MSENKEIQINRGLRNTYIDKTKSSMINGKEGILLYQGYNIHDLAKYSTFEETSYLLIHGRLPNNKELDDFNQELRNNRELSPQILEIIKLLKNSHPMDVLRTAISAMSVPVNNQTNLETFALTHGMRILAAVPTIITAHQRIRNGNEVIPPNKNLSHASNFLYMLSGEIPDQIESDLIDKDFILHAEHGVNASSFTARVTASTKADFYAAITAAISSLKGPLHGGAAEGVMNMANEIGSKENVETYVDSFLKSGGRIMGLGHAVYKTADPRAIHLKEGAEQLSELKGNPKWFAILNAITETKAVQMRQRRGIHPNVDFWAGAIYSLIGIPDDLFVPIFAIGRIPGWIIHILEQYQSNILIRPAISYNGPEELKYININERNN
ncbi:MAG: citrate (Si)-synthase [Chloroflexi bacterium]|nr:citrate (Si)-synthase [Chloroflexota bacterium]MCH2308164.1 citrate (Si)-synthase [SAR202 cluster bacterium]MQG05872.1 citrate (Si)-synthase [SAR202 cluster bacterium]